jgi:hypothetical protein
MGTCELREENLIEKHRFSYMTGVSVDMTTLNNGLSRNPLKEGQGPHCGVEPMIMIFITSLMILVTVGMAIRF